MEHVYWNIHRTSLGTTWLCSCFLETLPCCLYKVADQGLGSHFTKISWIYDWNHWDFLVDPSIIADDLIRPLFAHAMTAVMACARLWPDLFIRLRKSIILYKTWIVNSLWTLCEVGPRVLSLSTMAGLTCYFHISHNQDISAQHSDVEKKIYLCNDWTSRFGHFVM